MNQNNPFLTALLLAATAADGLLAGASLDQSIKQLPARHRIGVRTYSSYSRAADLGNGIAFYGILGVGAAALTIAAAVTLYRTGASARPCAGQLGCGAAAAGFAATEPSGLESARRPT